MKENIKENIAGIIIRRVFFIVGGIIGFLIGLLLNRFFPILFIISVLCFIFASILSGILKGKNILSSIIFTIKRLIFFAVEVVVLVVVVFVGAFNTYPVVKKFNSVVVKESEHFTVYVPKKYLEETDTEYLQNIIENIEKKYDAFISIYGTDEDNNKKISILIVDDFEKGIGKFFINTPENAAAGVMPIIKNAIFINGYYSVGEEDTFLHELQHVCMENRNRKKYSILYHWVNIFNSIYSRGSSDWFTECFSGSIDCFNHFFDGKNSELYNYEWYYKSLMFYDWNNTYSNYDSAKSFMKYLYIKSNYDINIFKDILSHANLNNGIEAILKVTEERFGINTWGDLLIDWGYNSLEQSIYTNTIREKKLDSYINSSINSDYEIIHDRGELLKIKRGKKETVKLYSGTVMIVRDVLTAHEDLIVKDCGIYKIIANKSRKYNNYIEVDIIKSSDYYHEVIHIDESDMEVYLPGKRELRLKYIPNGTKLRDIEGNKLIIQLEDKMVICKIVNGTYKIIETIPIFYRLNSGRLVITERRPKYRYRYRDVLYYYDDGSYTSDEVIYINEKMQIKKFYRIIEEKKLVD